MDNFIDKLAQKFTAQEMIKANSAAEEREMKRLRDQVSEYETFLQEMRKMNLKNVESAEKVKVLTETGCNDMNRIAEESLRKITQITDATKLEGEGEILTNTQITKDNTAALLEQVVAIEKSILENQTKLEEMFRQADDFLHKENVKVYRNVQAVVVEELKSQTEMLQKNSGTGTEKQNAGLKVMVVITCVLTLINLAFSIINTPGLF